LNPDNPHKLNFIPYPVRVLINIYTFFYL